MAEYGEAPSRSQLAAFELLIAVMEEEGVTSVNLRDLLMAGGDSISRYRGARDHMQRMRRATNDKPRIFADSLDETIFDDLTLGDLNVEVPLEKLIEFKEGQTR